MEVALDELALELVGHKGNVAIRTIVWVIDPETKARTVRDLVEWDLTVNSNLKVWASWTKRYLDSYEFKFSTPEGFPPFKNGTTRIDTRLRAVAEYLMVERLKLVESGNHTY